MLNRPSTSKLFLSAVAGFVIGAALVYFPGSVIMKPGMRKGQPQEIYQIYFHDLTEGIHLSEQDRLSADQLHKRTVWLCVLLNELDCMPFLMLTTFAGPTFLLLRWRRSTSKIDQTA